MYERKDILKCMNSEFCSICKSECEKVHTREDWKTDLNNDFFIGALVDEDIVEDCLNVLPPATMRNDLVQMGEPYSHREDKNGRFRPTFSTFAKTFKGWVYAGNCFINSTENIN